MLKILKTVADFATTPSNFLLLLAILALIALLFHWRRTAFAALTTAVAGFAIFGYTYAGEFLMAPLVARFPPPDLETAAPPHGIIVLGSGLNEIHAAHTGVLMELTDGGEAIPVAALLAVRYPDARFILSGGNGGDFPGSPLHQTDGMLRVMAAFGIDPARIQLEPSSFTTTDRVQNTLALVGEDTDKTWWVITPAHRMPRVIGSYRKVGFDPIPYPIDFKWVPPFDPTYTYPLLGGLKITDSAVHEWRGLIQYYVAGRIDRLFPAP